MKITEFVLLLAAAFSLIPATLGESGCSTNVDGDVFFDDGDHWIVPVGWVFEADFIFNNEPPFSISEVNNAPGAYEVPEIDPEITDNVYTVNARYNCTEQTNGDEGEYLHLEYGFEQPESGFCDTLFECCDVGCEFVSANTNPGCGEEFEATINIHACPDASVQVTELSDSRAEIVNIGRVWRDGDSITVNFQCPESRSDETFIEIQVADQYGGIDTCSISMGCEFCLKTCDCPMCAPPDKGWVCYVDGEGDIALYAMTSEEIEAAGDHMFYPTETYKGTQYDCYCEPVIDYPPQGSTFICNYDINADQFRMTTVQTESRPGLLNDLEDFLNEGTGFPGEYSTHPVSGEMVYLDGWCQEA